MNEKISKILKECGIEEKDLNCDDYIAAEILESIMIAEIIIEIEEMYDIEIDGDDIIPENFKNLEAIIAMVKKNGGK